ncbi:MAG: hypothetical protein COU63_02745 [Candidatus Pacebacteria bacterium CG10_big_fil_rev_8_21_14_0_10_36_11]|nr:phospholipid carrier-dependent glycosyltransferase [Candidatus Pacearchaeota archaeon]OIP74346.1 MAG: hypothetical protein AUK08_01000 [Candidatus Pacebacteria bacterium CG2_30_36_39]PIR64910.1 MAG: hypothetical protein COU63_02745 [Candidatus Pacebacteria bacterium CG10_big_fil_rev_8_21_14_0_10_36_11]
MKKLFLKLDKKCETNLETLILWLLIVILRIPNFFEPYWYGDEAIYLTLGTGLRNGLKLYTDIIDHKTPIIYYLAMVPNQFYFRLLNFGWMIVTTTLFFMFAKKLFNSAKYAFISSLIFVLLTTLPWFEGHLPNGELFVMGFVMVGLTFFAKTKLFKNFVEDNQEDALQKTSKKEFGLLIASGIFLGFGILTKVPALLDFGAVALLGWFSFSEILIKKSIEIKEKVSLFWKFISKSIALFVGILIPIIASIIYFVAIGSGKDYLDYGLLYNIRYSGSWHPEFPNQLIAFFFSLPGKVLIMAGLIYVLSFAKKKISPIFKFISGWFILSLFASLLSNRPYPHYLLQVVPAFSLLVGVFLNKITLWKKQYRELLLGTLLFALPIYIMLLLNVRPYETGHYYSQFYKFVSGEITNEEYDSGFNPMVNDNYQVAKIIRGMNLDRIFIWGTNPMLYAVSETTPTSRFTVSFHIKDFKDHERTLAQIKKEKPRMIVVMKDENEKFYELQQYLDSFYYANDTQYQTMTVYLRQTDN